MALSSSHIPASTVSCMHYIVVSPAKFFELCLLSDRWHIYFLSYDFKIHGHVYRDQMIIVKQRWQDWDYVAIFSCMQTMENSQNFSLGQNCSCVPFVRFQRNSFCTISANSGQWLLAYKCSLQNGHLLEMLEIFVCNELSEWIQKSSISYHGKVGKIIRSRPFKSLVGYEQMKQSVRGPSNVWHDISWDTWCHHVSVLAETKSVYTEPCTPQAWTAMLSTIRKTSAVLEISIITEIWHRSTAKASLHWAVIALVWKRKQHVERKYVVYEKRNFPVRKTSRLCVCFWNLRSWAYSRHCIRWGRNAGVQKQSNGLILAWDTCFIANISMQ